MNRHLFVACWIFALPYVLSAQYFTVDTIKAVDIYDQASRFPEVIPPNSKSAWPEDAANTINTYLKYKLLTQVQGKEAENIFGVVFPNEENFGGQSEFDFSVLANNRQFISLLISYSFTGAYTEYSDEYFSFSSHNGEHLRLYDFFEGDNYTVVGDLVSKECVNTINAFLADLDAEDEYSQDQRGMYKECLESFADGGFPSNTFYLTDSTMVFTRYRCSNHMMAALDDLWKFHVPMSFEQLRPYLSDKGRRLLLHETLDIPANVHLPEDKILRGTLDGKYPITALFSGLTGNYLTGVYWYDNYKIPIELYGSRLTEGVYEFWEMKDDKRIARFEFMYQNGQIVGVWEKADGSASLPLVLRVD